MSKPLLQVMTRREVKINKRERSFRDVRVVFRAKEDGLHSAPGLHTQVNFGNGVVGSILL